MPNKKLFGDLVKEHVAKASKIEIPGIEGGIDLQYIETQRALLNKLMSTDSSARPEVHIPLKEALFSPDASVLFPKVISDVLMRPKEPVMFGQTVLAKTITIDNTRSVEFPTIGAVRAKDLAEGQEFPEVQPPFGEAMTEIKVGKVGLLIAVSEDVIRDSMWDVLALYIEAAGYAMLRHKEEKIFREFQSKAYVAIDNSNTTDENGWTKGVDASGNINGSLSFNDLIDSIGCLIAHEYAPTDIIMHPLAWTIFMKDPRLQFQLLTHGSIGTTYGTMGQDNIASNLPWNLNVMITPFCPYSTSTALTLDSVGSNRTGPVSDIYIVDRNNGIVILERDPMMIDSFDDPRRDILSMKFKERYGLGLLNGGKSAVALKNIHITPNYEPLYSVRTKSM